MSASKFPIPDSVLAVAGQAWVDPWSGGQFEDVFDGESRQARERRLDPSWYVDYGEGHRDDNGAVMFSNAEMTTIFKSGALRGFAGKDGSTLLVNEHAMHALEDFCRETSRAWRKFNARLDRIPESTTFRPGQDRITK